MSKFLNLKKYLDKKNCLKIICGANNEDYDEIKKIVALYSKAGCRFFDINASYEAYNSSLEGLKFSNCLDDNHFICISVGADDDVHFRKCLIDEKTCNKCGLCADNCLQKAISDFKINEKKCIGCGICMENCPSGAILSYQTGKDFNEFNDLFLKVDCVEFHISSSNIDEIKAKWQNLISSFDGLISICINRAIFSEKSMFELIHYLIKTHPDIMIQADGKSMSGSCDDYNTTLQAVAFGDLLKKTQINCPIFISGGTNSKTKELLNILSVDIDGISIGSYARKIVKDYIERDDFWNNKDVFYAALEIAKKFVYKITQNN